VKILRVLALALLVGAGAFLFLVPLGGHTLFEWARSVFSTPEAAAAGEGIARGAGELVEKAKDVASGSARPAANAPGSAEAADSSSAAPERAAPELAAPPMDDHPPADEARLRKLLGSR
jgi:hypothetical protein